MIQRNLLIKPSILPNVSYFAINLKKLRKAKRLSQSQFAKIFGLTRATVGAYEEARAEPKLDKLIEIAKYFGLTVDQLVAKRITVNEIFHYDQKLSTVNHTIPFVRLEDKKTFIEQIQKEQKVTISKSIAIPGLNADLAIETDSFFDLKNSIVFGIKTHYIEPGKFYFQILNNDYNFFFAKEKQKHDTKLIWKVCCVLTKDLDKLQTQNALLAKIDYKLDMLLNYQKKAKQ